MNTSSLAVARRDDNARDEYIWKNGDAGVTMWFRLPESESKSKQ